MSVATSLLKETLISAGLALFGIVALLALFSVLSDRYARRKREGETPYGDVPRDPR